MDGRAGHGCVGYWLDFTKCVTLSLTSPLLARHAADVGRHGRNGGQINVDGSKIVIRHGLVHRPRHHLEQLAGVIGVLACADDMEERFEGQACGLAVFKRRDVARDERTKCLATRQVARDIHLLRRTEKRVRVLVYGGAVWQSLQPPTAFTK